MGGPHGGGLDVVAGWGWDGVRFGVFSSYYREEDGGTEDGKVERMVVGVRCRVGGSSYVQYKRLFGNLLLWMSS